MYRESKWLLSDFESDVWEFEMQAPNLGDFRVNFNITLSDGTLLTHKKNVRLLNTFKYWINASVHSDNTRGRGTGYADATANTILVKVLYIIDYFLLNDEWLKVTVSGFQGITEDHMKHLAGRHATHKTSAEYIYNWSEKLSQYLLEEIATSDKAELLSLIESVDDVDFTTLSEDQLESDNLLIPIEMIPLVRGWLWKNGYYYKPSKGMYSYVVNTRELAKQLYEKATLRGPKGTLRPLILCLGECDDTQREYQRVPVTSVNTKTISYTTVSAFKKALGALFLLKDEDLFDERLLLPPDEAIHAYLDHTPGNISSNRFSSLPSQVVLNSVKSAIEFHLENADALHKSLANVLAELAKKRDPLGIGDRNSMAKLIDDKEFVALMHPNVKKLGVEKWTINKLKNRFEALRSNKGLCELIRVYYGGTAIVLGALMARRQTELINLIANKCLDKSKQYLVFDNAKSTQLLDGLRVTVARPIDEIAVEMIETLIGFQRLYVENGFMQEMGELFDSVSHMDASKLLSPLKTPQIYNQNIDLFCDYFENAAEGW